MLYIPNVLQSCKRCASLKVLSGTNFRLRYNKKNKRKYFVGICMECERREALERARANPEVHRRKAKENYWKDPKAHKVRRKQQREADPARTQEQNHATYLRNRDKKLAYAKDYRAKHPDKIKESFREWTKANRDVLYACIARRDARKQNLPNRFKASDWRGAVEYFRERCAYCGSNSKLTIEHWIPLSDPRPDNPGTVPENILPACARCNNSKYCIQPFEWLVRRFGAAQAEVISSQIEAYFAMIVERPKKRD